MTQPRIYLGGSFDPVHIGHLRVAIEVHERFGLAVRMMPVADPVHRDPLTANATQRLDMLRLATRALDGVTVDETEILLGPPTYTSRTLESIHAQHPNAPLVFVVGSDAFHHIRAWKRYPAVLDQAHFLVVRRPGTSLKRVTSEFGNRMTEAPDWSTIGGSLSVLDFPPLDISATEVREILVSGRSARFLVPDAVLEFAERNAIYRNP